MTKKEQEPRNNEEERTEQPKDLIYNSNITVEDKEVLNNQSEDESKGDYFGDREEPIDFEGDDLDIPEFDDDQFNPTANKPDDSELEERPKESADDLDSGDSNAETIYKGEKANRYRDPSEKTRKDK